MLCRGQRPSDWVASVCQIPGGRCHGGSPAGASFVSCCLWPAFITFYCQRECAAVVQPFHLASSSMRFYFQHTTEMWAGPVKKRKQIDIMAESVAITQTNTGFVPLVFKYNLNKCSVHVFIWEAMSIWVRLLYMTKHNSWQTCLAPEVLCICGEQITTWCKMFSGLFAKTTIFTGAWAFPES